jgi:hypothetical protein
VTCSCVLLRHQRRRRRRHRFVATGTTNTVHRYDVLRYIGVDCVVVLLSYALQTKLRRRPDRVVRNRIYEDDVVSSGSSIDTREPTGRVARFLSKASAAADTYGLLALLCAAGVALPSLIGIPYFAAVVWRCVTVSYSRGETNISEINPVPFLWYCGANIAVLYAYQFSFFHDAVSSQIARLVGLVSYVALSSTLFFTLLRSLLYSPPLSSLLSSLLSSTHCAQSLHMLHSLRSIRSSSSVCLLFFISLFTRSRCLFLFTLSVFPPNSCIIISVCSAFSLTLVTHSCLHHSVCSLHPPTLV